MFPPGLKGPHAADFREAPPSATAPADYPARLPFVSNQAMSFAETDDLASCIWPALPVGQLHADKPDRPVRPTGLRGAVTGALDFIDLAVGTLTPDPVTKALVDDLLERVLVAAEAAGWTLNENAATPFPPGSRHASLSRPGSRLQVMAVVSPTESAVTAWSFADSAA